MIATNLESIINSYWHDISFRTTNARKIQAWIKDIPRLTIIIDDFINYNIRLTSLVLRLEDVLQANSDWGVNEYNFINELNKLSKHHNDRGTTGDALRSTLTYLQADNLGSRIESFYNFLQTEKDRLRRDGKTPAMIVAASRSAFIVSLFAYWLDRNKQPIICYDKVRKALNTLINITEYTPATPDAEIWNSKNTRIKREADYNEVVRFVNYINHSYPELNTKEPLWFESFCLWLVDKYLPSIENTSSTLVKDNDSSEPLAKAPTQPLAEQPAHKNGKEEVTDSLPPLPDHDHIENEQLMPTPEPALTRFIQEVQQHILVEESVIRRIYHGLLAGHVILTGPPGTGKTELARLIPELLWQSDAEDPIVKDGQDEDTEAEPEQEAVSKQSSETAYTTRLVTATDDWSTRTLISGIVPQVVDGIMTYKVQYGHLTAAILKNWSFLDESGQPERWSRVKLRRTRVVSAAGIDRGVRQKFRGLWLVIDEFNRAPIDLALGEAMTTLGGHDVLRVNIESGSAELPVPRDFRIIGTLNSFDRNYLNQISEALKRRFSSVEILPPGRAQRQAEQAMVLRKALLRVAHLSKDTISNKGALTWQDRVTIETEATGQFSLRWEEGPFQQAFETTWRIFEVIRIYRQLGTAQAISLLRHLLIAGILQNYTSLDDWCERALDAALCDTIADQLQVLLPDEIETLFLYITGDATAFVSGYQELVRYLQTRMPQRFAGQMMALSSITDENGEQYITGEQSKQIIAQDLPVIPEAALQKLFHLSENRPRLPLFTRRLQLFKAERGL